MCDYGPKGPTHPGSPPEVTDYLEEPTEDLLRHAKKCAREGGVSSPLFKPLVPAIASGVYGTAAGDRRDKAGPAVEAWVLRLQRSGEGVNA